MPSKSLTFDRSQTITLIALHAVACVAGFFLSVRSGFAQLAMVAVLMVLNIGAYYCVKWVRYQIVGHGAPQV